jgi:C-3',4' desaturase CrtD
VTKQVVVVGAGVGGLVAAATLARSGLDVTVLEAHIYPGGCAGTFYHQGYRFDAGATLTAGFEPDGIMAGLGEQLGIAWPAHAAIEAMVVHLPDMPPVTQWTGSERWRAERERAFGPAAEPFWAWQERTANLMWQAARQGTPWPPASLGELARLTRTGLSLAGRGLPQLPGLAADSMRSVAAHLPRDVEPLRLFIDAQLLISAQATSARANALYGAAALDLPRRGIVHLEGGMGALGQLLADALRRQGGKVLYRQQVTRVVRTSGGSLRIETNKGAILDADAVVFNLPPWDAERLLQDGPDQSEARRARPGAFKGAASVAAQVPSDGWGAFILYAGVDEALIPHGFPLHHQIVVREPLGEGNSVFMTLSLEGDAGRAPAGKRALTASTHTALGPWWDLFERDRPAYEARKELWAERVWAAIESVLPGARAAAALALPGTPVTFARFTHRTLGWVGGFPQTSLLRARNPRLGPGLWLVGDSVFPGQSTLAVTLGGLRVADAVIAGSHEASARYRVLGPRESPVN